ncbi:MAG: hypothetical protein LBJ68_00100 [Endomicrobium sp.]|jgi:biotin carboxyl carrier protein|nr:hypothetical protein [Endomicrobium sp.]
MTNNIKEKVKSIYDVMKEENVLELDVKSKDYGIYIRRKNNNDKEFKKQKINFEDDREDDREESVVLGTTIKSPLTGIFYRAPSPSSKVYVNEGDIVEIGNTVCLIEAMKVMNEIKATFKAKILKILIENGSSVNSGQSLFEVEKI